MQAFDKLPLEQLPPLFHTAPLVLLALVPILFMTFTSFVKFNIIFAILRNALGGSQIPSPALCGLLAIILSLYTFMPVGMDIANNIGALKIDNINDQQSSTDNNDSLKVSSKQLSSLWLAIKYPLENHLVKHSDLRERAFFTTRLSETEPKCDDVLNLPQEKGCRFNNESIVTLAPAFLLSEIKDAFTIGFSIFIPFLVIDLVVANILVALGMMMVSPVTISFPLKLLLFVLSDGWYLLCKNLIINY
ncbi:MAG: EscR/YscR/HrcR family type III secretion system export apparatus protein [Deltaproteobacteria bacterium]|nr:EscR/YscR/HrcR family type III secretion system export apparatus protein [Deltaproteobacteria bacterium]